VPRHLNDLPFDLQHNGHYREFARIVTAERYIFDANFLPLVIKKVTGMKTQHCPKERCKMPSLCQ
jgi:hypothetical protein